MASVEEAAQGGDVAVAGLDGEERAKLREKAYELGLRPAGGATVAELEALIARNDVVALTLEKRAEVLDYIREHPACSVAEACRSVRVKRAEVRALLQSDPEFYEDYERARGRVTLEDIYEATELMAVHGVDEPLVSAGKLVHYPDGHEKAGEIVYVKKRDPKLLEFLNRTRTPEGKAAEARKLGIEISGPNGGPVEVQAGVGMDAIAAVFAAAGVRMPSIEAPEGTAEIVGMQDEEVG